MSFLDISEEIRQLGAKAEKAVRPYFDAIDEISEYNTEKVLAAFAKNRVAEVMFAGTTGYGYDDKGRDTLDQIYADIFGTEAALVRIGFVNGTHALCCAMYSAVKTGDVVLSATGPAYDTLMNTITGDMAGSMKQYGIGYRQVEMKNGLPDVPAIAEAAKAEDVKLVFIQRSKGYGVRESLSCEQIGEVCQAVRAVNKDAVIMVDNCYGEFVEKLEPTQGACRHDNLILISRHVPRNRRHEGIHRCARLNALAEAAQRFRLAKCNGLNDVMARIFWQRMYFESHHLHDLCAEHGGLDDA